METRKSSFLNSQLESRYAPAIWDLMPWSNVWNMHLNAFYQILWFFYWHYIENGRQKYVLVSFKLYDLDGNGFIDKPELLLILKSAMLESATLELSEKHLNDIVELTFSMASKHPDRMSYGTNRNTIWFRTVFDNYTMITNCGSMIDEYFSMVSENPALLSSLRVDLRSAMTNNKNTTIWLLEDAHQPTLLNMALKLHLYLYSAAESLHLHFILP